MKIIYEQRPIWININLFVIMCVRAIKSLKEYLVLENRLQLGFTTIQILVFFFNVSLILLKIR